MTTSRQQPYDSSLKALLAENAATILPIFIKGAVFINELDVELLSPARRADRVFLIQLEGQQCIVDMEIQSSVDKTIVTRLLLYRSQLRHKYQMPVISMVIYPFEMALPESPFEEKVGTQKLLEYHFEVVALFKIQAHQYVQQHAIDMYALLPTMQGFDIELLSQALEEMRQAYQDDEAKLARQLLWMGILLQRSTSIPVDTKLEIQRRFNMFDQLLEEDPRVIQLMAEREARGRMEGKAEGIAEGKAALITTLIATRFPSITEEIRQKLPLVRRSEDLDTIAKLTFTAPDENALLWVLDSMVA